MRLNTEQVPKPLNQVLPIQPPARLGGRTVIEFGEPRGISTRRLSGKGASEFLTTSDFHSNPLLTSASGWNALRCQARPFDEVKAVPRLTMTNSPARKAILFT